MYNAYWTVQRVLKINCPIYWTLILIIFSIGFRFCRIVRRFPGVLFRHYCTTHIECMNCNYFGLIAPRTLYRSTSATKLFLCYRKVIKKSTHIYLKRISIFFSDTKFGGSPYKEIHVPGFCKAWKIKWRPFYVNSLHISMFCKLDTQIPLTCVVQVSSSLNHTPENTIFLPF